MSNTVCIKDYFNGFSSNYDKENEKNYWRLSDEILWNHLIKRIKKSEFMFLDLGGGTGTWSKRILDMYPWSYGKLYDISDGMIDICKQKLKEYLNRVDIIKGDIIDIKSYGNADYIFLVYVLMFIKDQETALLNAKKLIKDDGRIFFVVENQLNGMAVNLLNDNVEEAICIYKNSYGSITEKVPKIYYNTIDNVKAMCERVGLEITYYAGFPVFTTIGVKRINDDKYRKMKYILSDEKKYKSILDIEKDLSSNQDLALRGKYILFEAKKRGK